MFNAGEYSSDDTVLINVLAPVLVKTLLGDIADADDKHAPNDDRSGDRRTSSGGDYTDSVEPVDVAIDCGSPCGPIGTPFFRAS